MLSVEIDALRMADALEICRRAIHERRRLTLGMVNAAKLVRMRSDPLLRRSVCSADLVLADGMAVVWASRILGAPLPERVAGIDLFEELLALAHQERYSVYLLGATSEAVEGVAEHIRSVHPGVSIAGYRDGYFTDAEAEDVVREISAHRPDVLFIGIPTPKKELFLERWREQLDVVVCHGVGGSFDVLAGQTKRAPELWQRLGMEWLYRLLQEPRRMWRRYLVTNTAFIAQVLSSWIASRLRAAP